MKTEHVFGTLVAAAIANFAVVQVARADEAKPANEAYCQNNSCKGKSACKGHGNDACGGKNSCKGHGFLKAADEKACTKAGGKWMKG